MKMRVRPFVGVLLAAFFACPVAYSQNQSATPPASKERHIGRIAGTIGGAIGGFLLGFAVSDDDAINSTAKMTRNVVIGAVAGGFGGYFLGRTIDKKLALNYSPDPQATRLARVRLEQKLAQPTPANSGNSGQPLFFGESPALRAIGAR